MKATKPLLEASGVTVRHAVRRGFAARGQFIALDDVSLSIWNGSTLALVGKSGSGKSTLALCLAGLERPTSGRIYFEGRDIASLREKELRAVRPHIQLIFQDPAAALNPRMTALEIVAEPLRLTRRMRRSELEDCTQMLLQRVGVSGELAARRPAELSGGQRQRLAIARALALEPKLVILDEALSALDCSVQAQITNLLLELQDTLGITYLFITHDMAMAAHLADEIAVIDRGRIVEHGRTEDLVAYPRQEATRALLAATPRILTPAGAILDQP
jgi:peptide/nickel transport system ATP-binding protein